ncbi:SLAM family member 5-like [Engraulis encrasicolus]|uniref:SLAM family member 5-like n=1 Tax=Engraulis encrasicolus TaxID=184585 RepID=UPI002FD4C1D9
MHREMFQRRSLTVSSTRVLALILLQGVCVWSVKIHTVNAVLGGSVVLPSEHRREDVKSADWLINNTIIVEYVNNNEPVYKAKGQIKGSFKMNSHNLSLAISNIRQEHNGEFQLTGIDKRGTQISTTTFKLLVHESTLKVHITQEPPVRLNNTCTITLTCNASGPPGATFSWSGHRTGNDASVQFSLKPEDGSVRMKCSAQRNPNEKDEQEVIIKCANTTNGTAPIVVVTLAPPTDTDILWWYVYHIAIPAAGGLCLLILSIAVGVCYCKKKNAEGNEDNTCYADITIGRKDNPQLQGQLLDHT